MFPSGEAIMNRVAVRPELIRWARERAGLEPEVLAKKFPKLADWESGVLMPTFKQLEDFSRVVHVPFGYLFLPEPPEISLPIPDFRTLQNRRLGTVSPDLLDIIYAMQRRQAWLREEYIEAGAEPLSFVGSVRLDDEPAAVGREMRRLTSLEADWAARVPTWQKAVGRLCQALEQLGVMTVINGVVGNNTRRKLDVEEFRGFALVDKYAPLIFVNGADAKSAQMFSLAHELAHIWLGEEGSGLSGYRDLSPGDKQVEKFCDQAAAEFLVPEAELRAYWDQVRREAEPFQALARHFKVSPIVAARRALDLRLIGRQDFVGFYQAYTQRERKQSQGAGGGNFYKNQNVRVGKLFATRVIRAAKEGRIGFKQAYELTGLKGGSFQEYARSLNLELPGGG